MSEIDLVIFVGPSLYGVGIDHFPGEMWKAPAVQGDIVRSVIHDKPKKILLIDGCFHQSLSVWHKGLVYALLEGVVCIGAASMGALRAAELHRYGMIGVGKIFEMYRDGEEDDSLVAMLFDPETYRPVQEAAVGQSQKVKDAMLAIEFARSYKGTVSTSLDRDAITPYLNDMLKRILDE